MIKCDEPRRLGVPDPKARLRFEAEQGESGGRPGRRLLVVDGEPAFELSHWCGTCPFLFRRLETAKQKLSLEDVRERLTGTPAGPGDGGVIDAFGALLPEGDYFSGEQVDSWGLDQSWGLPEYPHTPYYRTFETAVDASAHPL